MLEGGQGELERWNDRTRGLHHDVRQVATREEGAVGTDGQHARTDGPEQIGACLDDSVGTPEGLGRRDRPRDIDIRDGGCAHAGGGQTLSEKEAFAADRADPDDRDPNGLR